MSKLSRKAKLKEKEIEDKGKKTLIYLGVGLLVLAVLLGILLR